jgi:hypothetical protein
MTTPMIRYIVFFILTTFSTIAAAADTSEKDAPIPESINSGLNYLLALAEPVHTKQFDSGAIEEVIHFVLSSKNKNELYFPGNRTNIASAYHEFDIHNNLNHILEIGFNPNIPPFILSPSSIRLAYWTEINGKKQPPPDMSSMLARLDQPIMVSGVEHEEITPDLNTGAYYGYDLNRTLILLKYQGRPALISVSKQKNVSDVGKKGVVLGKDGNWDYFYSGQNGLNKPGLGWVSSYMYDSYTISLFIEQDGVPSRVHCGIFKWLRAGWADINMVQNQHIYRGLQRYTDTVKEVLEYPDLPEPDKMAEIFSMIQRFSADELRDKVKKYITLLSKKYENDSDSGGKLMAETINDDDSYVNRLSPHQMRSALIVEYMKFLLGKNSIQDVAYFISPTNINQHRKG